jgi:peptide/nickel transport system permease protein
MMAVADTGSSRRAKRALVAPLLLMSALIIVAGAAPLLAPFDPRAQPDIIALKSLAPSWTHPFGTDPLSRDVLTRVLYGARISLRVASLSVALALLLGTAYGATAAIAGGAIDRVLMRLLDVLLALPRLLWLLAITALWDGLPLSGLIVLLGLTSWYGVARIVRGEVQAQLKRDYTVAARALGVRQPRFFVRHLLPQLLPALAVWASIGVAQTIGLEAGLSFLGLGVQPPAASWGTIMQDGASVMQTQWWLTLFPGLATLLTVVACNWLGDALRDIFAAEQVPA